ncbi:hypothetical protein HDK77DRAFT_305496 [Phyllosticta capitalensis]
MVANTNCHQHKAATPSLLSLAAPSSLLTDPPTIAVLASFPTAFPNPPLATPTTRAETKHSSATQPQPTASTQATVRGKESPSLKHSQSAGRERVYSGVRKATKRQFRRTAASRADTTSSGVQRAVESRGVARQPASQRGVERTSRTALQVCGARDGCGGAETGRGDGRVAGREECGGRREDLVGS